MHIRPLTATLDDGFSDPEIEVLADRDLFEFRCGRCGYGISLSGALPSCPMCRTHLWVHVDTSERHS
jgi:rubrerythrin